jgi:menaquinone-dependent protoporphyrinogen oxidase
MSKESIEMVSKILVTYTTNAGSTTEVAEAIGRALTEGGTQVDLCRIGDVKDLGGYQAVVVGAPMIMGWHREAVAFLEAHHSELSRVPVACFATALSLTKTGDGVLGDTPVYLDPALARPPKNPKRPSYRENYATVSNYLGPVLAKVPQVRPVSVAFFGGKLDFGKLDLIQRLFVQFIIGARPGDFRNWDAIRAWATGLRAQLLAA